MNALRRLERGGYRFELTDGRLSFSYHGAEPVPPQWARPLLDEVRAGREQVVAILQARLDWAAVFDEWCERQPCDPAADASYVGRLAELAIAGLLPNYEDGETDAGPAAWRRLAESYERAAEQPAFVQRPLPF